MHPSRTIYEQAPAFIPVPAAMRQRKIEAIFWPLDPEAQTTSDPATPIPTAVPLSQLIGQAQGCFEHHNAIDDFIRTERDAWDR